MNRNPTILSILVLALTCSIASAAYNCSCYVYVGGYYGQQPYLLGDIENMTSCTNCTQETCQSTFVNVLSTLEQYYNFAYSLYIYPYCRQPPVPTSTMQVSEQVTNNVYVSSNLPNVKVNVNTSTDMQIQENVQENYYPSSSYGYYYPSDMYNYYYASCWYPYSYYYYYYYAPVYYQGNESEYRNVSKQLETIETQIQSVMQMLETINDTQQVDGIVTNLTALSNYVTMFEKVTNSSLNVTQMLLSNIEMSMNSNFTTVYEDLKHLRRNLSNDSNYTMEELNKVLYELKESSNNCTNNTKTIETMEKNISRLNTEYEEMQKNLSSVNSRLATTPVTTSNKAVSSGSTSPTAIAGVVLGTVAVAGVAIVVVLVVMRIIV